MSIIRTQDKFTTVHRDDGKIVIASDTVYEHIGTHQSPGKGSVFSGNVTEGMINAFLANADIPDSGGGIPADFSTTSGYLLVAPYEIAMKFDNATVQAGTKEDFDPVKKEMVPVPIAEVHTSQSIEDFKTSETTILVFPYDPTRSTPEQNDFIESNEELAVAKENGNLYALATAFPGGFSIDEVGGIKFPKKQVPKATAWGGVKNPKWAVIIPNSSVLESSRWNQLAGIDE